MSHYAQFKLKSMSNVKQDYLEKALKDMGFGIKFGKTTLSSSYRNDSNEVDAIIVDENDGPTSVGIRFYANEKNEISAEFCGDFYYLKGFSHEKNFQDELEKHYTKYRMIDVVLDEGYVLESQETNENGEIVLMCRQYA